MFRLAVVVAMAAIVGSSCASSDGRTVELEAWPQIGRRIDITLQVDGDEAVDAADDERWARRLEVDGEFDIELRVVDPLGEQVRCSIELDGIDPIAAVGNGEARCAVSGRVDGDVLDVEVDTFGAIRPPESEPDPEPEP